MGEGAQYKYYRIKLVWLSLVVLTFASCNTTKYLKEDQSLLKQNTIKFEDGRQLEDKFTLKSNLQSVIKQKPNSRYFGIKREWLYQKTKDKSADAWLRKNSEAPTIYDSLSTEQSKTSLKNYMFNRGFFDTEVTHELRIKNKKAYSTYTISAKSPYVIGELNYLSSDPAIAPLLDSLENTSLLKIGEVLDDSDYTLEKTRITRAFLNHGYADFYANLISPLQVDTTGNQTLVSLRVYLPPDADEHIKKQVGQIEVSTDYIPGSRTNELNDTVVSGVRFKIPESGPSVEYPTILDKIFLKEGITTSQINLDNTYRGLSDLGVYKFITITPKEDSLRPDIINYDIQLTKRKKWVFDAGLDLNYSTLQSQGFGRNLLGLTASSLIENRNLLNKAISWRVNGEVGAEVNLAQLDSFNTFTSTIETVIDVPRFTGFPGTLKFLSLMKVGKRRVINPKFYEDVVNRASTQFRARYQYASIVDFYRYQQFDINYGYDIPINNRKKYTIRTIGINYYRPDTLSRFTDITQGAEYFLRSFIGDRLFTGFLFRDFSFFYQSKQRQGGDYWTVNFYNEISGLEVWAVNSLYNAITNKTGKFRLKLDKEIDFARFAVFEFQYRYNKPLWGNTSVAFRFNPGITFSFDSLSVPFVKQFYVGGPQSIRAWQIRQLGPGSSNLSTEPPYFASGDFKLELNAEYRFDLFWRLESAVFLDIGNVWLLNSEDKEANIGADFLKEMAIGTGVGLRLDITFAILRLDMGYPLRNPYPDPDNGSYWFHNPSNPYKFGKMFSNINFNLAIGYPF